MPLGPWYFEPLVTNCSFCHKRDFSFYISKISAPPKEIAPYLALIMPFGGYVWLLLLISAFSVTFILIAMDSTYLMVFPSFHRTGYIFEGTKSHYLCLKIFTSREKWQSKIHHGLRIASKFKYDLWLWLEIKKPNIDLNVSPQETLNFRHLVHCIIFTWNGCEQKMVQAPHFLGKDCIDGDMVVHDHHFNLCIQTSPSIHTHHHHIWEANRQCWWYAPARGM